MPLHSIKEAIEDIKAGKMVIVVDDEDRENEGDFIMSAQAVTAQAVNFMATYGKGLICAPISSTIANRLRLPLMIEKGTDSLETAFTISVDASSGISTGISASDRAKTMQILADENSTAQMLSRPGHIFPLVAKDGGVLERAGHTEAAVELALLAGHSAAGMICEILNEDGSCARVPELIRMAKKFDLKLISIEGLIEYKKKLTQDNIYENQCITQP